MGVKSWFKRQKDKDAKVEAVIVQKIDIKSRSREWRDFLSNLHHNRLDEYKFFKKLGFPDGDKIKIVSTDVSEEIKAKVMELDSSKLYSSQYFYIISEQKGEFILEIKEDVMVVLITADLTKEKVYKFNFYIMEGPGLSMEKNRFVNKNMKSCVSYLYDWNVLVIEQKINENNQKLRLEFVFKKDMFDNIEESEEKITLVKEKSCNIISQLLELKKIPNNENNDGIIKLLEELELEDFFGSAILLKKIVLTSKNREDTVEFKDKKVESYRIKDLEQDIVREASIEEGLIQNSNYAIETSDEGTGIALFKITKDAWLNGINLPLSDFILEGMNEQKAMDELLTHVDHVLVKRLNLDNK